MSTAQATSAVSVDHDRHLADSRVTSGVRARLQVVREDESGMSTAEYAVGTVAAAGLGGVLIKLLSSPEVQSLIWSVITKAFSWLV